MKILKTVKKLINSLKNIEKKLDFLNISQQEEILSKLPFEEV